MKRIIPVAALALLGAMTLTACGEGAKSENPEKVAYEAALSDAKAEQKKAKAVGGEWRDIGKMLDKAEEAAAKGDYKDATKQANKAKFQAMAGQEQAKGEVGVGNPAYLTN